MRLKPVFLLKEKNKDLFLWLQREFGSSENSYENANILSQRSNLSLGEAGGLLVK